MTTIKTVFILLCIGIFISASFKPKKPYTLEKSIVGNWKLEAFYPKKMDTFSHKELIFMAINADGMTTGFMGCNSFRTLSRTYQDSITFETFFQTRRFCNRAYMEMENQLKSILTRSTTFNVQDNTLILFEGKRKLATFKKATYVQEP